MVTEIGKCDRWIRVRIERFESPGALERVSRERGRAR